MVGRFAVRVVGCSFAPGYPGALYRAARRREQLVVVREPHNAADPHAVAVRTAGGEPVGYLPAAVASRVAPGMDDGEQWVVARWRLATVAAAPGHPGVLLALERVQWAVDPPIRRRRLDDQSRPRRLADIRAYAKRMASRAAGMLAWRVGEDLWAVPSSSRPGTCWAVVADVDAHRCVWLLCGCPSGTYRPEQPIPCRHAAAVVAEMVRRKEALVAAGLAYAVPVPARR